MIYTVRKIGANTILTDYTIPIDNPYILAILNVPMDCNDTEKAVIITPVECNGDWTINFQGVQEVYEDLTAGQIYFSVGGTWLTSIYYQASSSNIDPDNATSLGTINLQVI